MAPFLLADQQAVARGEMNEFATAVHEVVKNLKDMLIVETETGVALTVLGYQIREVAIKGVQEFGNFLERAVTQVERFTEAGLLNINLIKLYFLPMTILITLFEKLNPELFRIILFMYILNKTLPLVTMVTAAWSAATWLAAGNIMILTEMMIVNGVQSQRMVISNGALTLSFGALGASIAGAFGGLYLGYELAKKISDAFHPLISVILGLGLAFGAMWVFATMGASTITTLPALGLTLAAMGGIGMAIQGMGAMLEPADASDEFAGYEAQLQGNYALAAGTTGAASAETLYVKKLNYTDSNEAEFIQAQSDTQIGAFQ
jgi:hypothetical protein